MPMLNDILLPWNHKEQPSNLFLSFKNSDGCILWLKKVHVPVTTSNINSLRNSADSLIISELNKQMKEKLETGSKECGPFLLPGSTFFLDSNPRPRRKATISQQSNSVSYFKKENSRRNNDTYNNLRDSVTANSGLLDVTELEKISSAFVNRRIEMNLSQTDVAISLGKLYGVHRSISVISRFERMNLSLSNYLKFYPVLLRWLKDSETAEGRDTIIRAIVDSRNNIDNNDNKSPVKESNSQVKDPISFNFPKRHQRTVLSDSVKCELEKAYQQKTCMNKYDFKELAMKLNIDKKTIQVWFYNRRNRNTLVNRKRKLIKPRQR
ncbi:unnamed protein product [Heterobilharzia americana]|nr:unnamed protein product [Heterobilharzia americana]